MHLATSRLLAVGEVLWDVFDDSVRLGGAPLNFCAHAKGLGYEPLLISAVGVDDLSERTFARLMELGLDTTFIQRVPELQTGTARVELDPDLQPRFMIRRPAAYDRVLISDAQIETLKTCAPSWLYYGTLFSSQREGKSVLEKLFEALPHCSRFYDLNLRRGSDSPALVNELLAASDVVKLNEDELEAVHNFTGLPSGLEAFCRAGSSRYGWQAVGVTLGARGCAILCGDNYVEAGGRNIEVADPVGAGDAFAAAFLHGLISEWSAAKIAAFANSVGALVASRPGAIPEWTLDEVAESGISSSSSARL